MLAPILTTAILATSLPAQAEGWDWESEEFYRDWRSETLNWASSIHPDKPSPMLLLALAEPPPREMWCLEDGNTTPSNFDLSTFDKLLDEWLHDYLDIPDEDPVPPILIIPDEC